MSFSLRRTSWVLALAVLGCASPHPRDPFAVHAECPVCKCEGDLACVDVTVGADKPHTTVEGRCYYFCSEDCRCAFERNEAKYVGTH